MVLSTLRGVLTRRPLLKSIVTVTSLICGADILCQVIENKGFDFKFNWLRFRNMAAVGMCYYGPFYFYYYGMLDRKLPGKNPRTILLKLFIDQCVVTIPSIVIFYAFVGQLEHKTIQESKDEIREKFLPTYVTSSMFWPVAQSVNFALVPSQYRVLMVSSCTFVWLTFLSYVKNRPKVPYIFQRINEITGSKQAQNAE